MIYHWLPIDIRAPRFVDSVTISFETYGAETMVDVRRSEIVVVPGSDHRGMVRVRIDGSANAAGFCDVIVDTVCGPQTATLPRKRLSDSPSQ